MPIIEHTGLTHSCEPRTPTRIIKGLHRLERKAQQDFLSSESFVQSRTHILLCQLYVLMKLARDTSTQTTMPGISMSGTNGDSHESFLKAPNFQNFESPPRVLVIGAGSRGTAYAEAILEGTNATVAAVCEPIDSKREAFGKRFVWSGESSRQPGQQFDNWREWVEYEERRRETEAKGLEIEPGVDAVFVCVLDEMHEEVVCGIAHLGVHICCEKPMSTRLESCVRIYKALNHAKGINAAKGKQKDPVFGICHVLRYSPHNMLLRHLVREKEVIGDILSIEHCEPVGWWHFSHSYVR